MNTITLTGNIVDEPKLKFTNTGTPLTDFRLAVSQGKDRPALFVDVTVWNDDITESVAELAKGTRVIVTGRLVQEDWEHEGKKYSKLKITAGDVAASCRWQKVKVNKIVKK